MNLSTKNFVSNSINSIRCCPFCGTSAHVFWVGLNPLTYGVRCRSCGASIPAIHTEYQDAVRAWNRRSGLAMLGGRATRGIRSRRKLAAARRNLKKARQTRQLNRLRQAEEVIYARLRPYRQQETAIIEAAVAGSRAELAILEPRIRQYPDLSELLDWLKRRWERAEGGDQHRNDSPQPEPGNSVLLGKHNGLDQY